MIQEARIEVEGSKVTIVIVAASPEEAQKIARTSSLKLEATGVEVPVIEQEDG